ncbi:hypothetical protein, partial [Salmonella enterica]|uniref:hypothetical protein n=1 Tax=Salmonella enterica TaxID=28901 RepID=UPI003134B395
RTFCWDARRHPADHVKASTSCRGLLLSECNLLPAISLINLVKAIKRLNEHFVGMPGATRQIM